MAMKTRTIDISRDSAHAAYFSAIAGHTKALRNTANFLIRNTMTGIRKSPEERTHNETEALHLVFTGIHAVNRKRRTPLPYPTPEKWMLNYYQLDAILKYADDENYRALPAQVNQQAIKKTCSSWTAYFKALAGWKRDPSKYTGKPRIPGYIREPYSTAHFTNQVIKPRLHGKELLLAFPCGGPALCVGKGISPLDVVKAEVKPFCGGFRLLVTYRTGTMAVPMPGTPGKLLGIDVGVRNLFACAGNFGGLPFLIDGEWLKSENQWFNKERARLTSRLTSGSDPSHSEKHSRRLYKLSLDRDHLFRDYFYKASHYIARYCVNAGVEAVIIGWNQGIKDGVSLGDKNNQNFVSIPLRHAADILSYVLAGYGIPSVIREESYTSKASFLDRDPLPDYGKEDGKPVFSGRRVKRGLYRSKDGQFINADINGALNIIRKEYPDAFAGTTDLSCLMGTVKRVTRAQLCGGKPGKKTPGKYRKMSDARKHNRREHRYRQLMYRKLFSRKSNRGQHERQAAAAAGRQEEAGHEAA